MPPKSPDPVCLNDLPAFCSASDVASLLHISRATAYRMAISGAIPSLRLGKRVIFSKELLQTWIDKTAGGV